MRKPLIYFLALTLLSLDLTFSPSLFAKAPPNQSRYDLAKRADPETKKSDDDYGETESEDIEYKYEDIDTRTYQGIRLMTGVGGSYYAKKGDFDLDGTVGLYQNIEFRFTKIFSFGFDTYYGYLMGSGSQYLSSFNPGIKIFPMMFKNPSFDPFIFLGGHVYDATYGTTSNTKAGMGQGFFSGVGAQMKFRGAPIGLEFFIRSSFLWMTQPSTIGGRSLTIPIFAAIGAFY